MPKPQESEAGEIHLLNLGGLQEGFLEGLSARLSRRVAVPCRAFVRPLLGSEVLLKERDQLDADLLLASIEPKAAKGVVVVGITGLDIGVPVFTFVFGRARVGGRAAVVSIARLDPEFYGLEASSSLLLARAHAEVLHELGHVASLGHCRDGECLMHFAGSVERADSRGEIFCYECALSLPAWLKPGVSAERY